MVKQLISKVSDAGFDSLVRHVILNCFKCDKVLEPVNRDWEYNQPYAGTTFIAYGQYGSTVFDPAPRTAISKEFLQLNICDSCLLENKNQLLHVLRVEQPAKFEYWPWDPEASMDGASSE